MSEPRRGRARSRRTRVERPAATGHAAGRRRLRSLDSLEGRPADEHVAVFEAAHASCGTRSSSADQPA